MHDDMHTETTITRETRIWSVARNVRRARPSLYSTASARPTARAMHFLTAHALFIVAAAALANGAVITPLSVSSLSACTVNGQVLVPGVTCTSALEDYLLMVINVGLDGIDSSTSVTSLINFDLATATPGGMSEPVTLSIVQTKGVVRSFESAPLPSGFAPFAYLGVCRTVGALTAPCPNGKPLIGNVPCFPDSTHDCALVGQTDFDNAYQTRIGGLTLVMTQTAYVPPGLTTPSLLYGGQMVTIQCMGGGLCTIPGNYVMQNYWIAPIYTMHIFSGGLSSVINYEIEITVTKTNTNTATTLTLSPSAQSDSFGNQIGAELFDITDPFASAISTFNGVLFAPIDSPYNQDGRSGVFDEWSNPRSPTNRPLPKWLYLLSTTNVYEGIGSACQKIGIRQDWETTAGDPQGTESVCSDPCNHCVPGYGSTAAVHTILQQRYNQWLNVLATPAMASTGVTGLPSLYNVRDPNYWWSNNKLFFQYPTVNPYAASIRLIVTGTFVSFQQSVTTATLQPFSSSSCNAVEGSFGGNFVVSVRETGGGSGNFRVEISCTGSVTVGSQNSATFSLGPSEIKNLTYSVTCPIGDAGASSTCTADLYSRPIIGETFVESQQIGCQCVAFLTPPPATLVPPGPPGPPGGSGGDDCGSLNILDPASFFKNLLCKLLGPLKILGIFLLLCCCCCYLCSSLASSLLCAPGLLGSAAAAGGASSALGFEVPPLLARDLPLALHARLPDRVSARIHAAAEQARSHWDLAALHTDRTLGRWLFGGGAAADSDSSDASDADSDDERASGRPLLAAPTSAPAGAQVPVIRARAHRQLS